MLAFITGASSGIGKEMAKVLAGKGYDLIITAKNEQKLFEVRNEILNNMYLANKEKNNRGIKKIKQDIDIKVISANLENEKEVFELYEKIKDEDIDVFINNAGFGTAGSFWETDLNTEINMVKVNDIAMHILFKLILKNMLNVENKKIAANIEENQNNDKSSANNWKGINNEKNSGNKEQDLSDEKYILNVSSLSGFMPGPKMSVYYATKAYMLNLTRGVYKELKMAKAKVNVSVLCPGPVYTNFADRAGVLFKTPNLSSEYTAKYAINKLFAKKLVIIPGILNKCAHVLSKIIPSKLVMSVVYRIQEKL